MSFKDTIEITDGVHAATNRRVLKTALEQFGEIDICHKIGDPREDPVWIRYRYSKDAEKALEEINKGNVFLGGVPLKAQWKTRSKEPPGRLDLAHGIMKEGHTSRDLYQASSSGRGDRGGRDRGGGSSRDLYSSGGGSSRDLYGGGREGGRRRRSRSRSRSRDDRRRDDRRRDDRGRDDHGVL
eukprot:TRINITY_DN7655_c4_g1_i1.p1 TRINITY_DN7655_c4_g1~~TRINITY_DN7655_c4_g1_i1.p1  ORF type:complete len:183 (+),score=22.51 TRINITY_DN7655_c4_g1_i1:81-629(+)